MMVDYDPESGTWHNTRQIDSGKGTYGDSDSRCSYPNGYNYDPRGWLHVTWVWREGPQTANHDLMYAFSKDNGVSWFNNAGVKLEEPPNVNSPDIAVETIPETYGLMNTQGQYVDTLGRIHVVMWHCSNESLGSVGVNPGESRWGPEDARHYHHYWRDHNAIWHHTEMEFPAGGRPKIFLDKDNNAYIIYNYKGDLVIASAMANSSWREWQIIHTEPGPFVNEMLGDYYLWKSENILSVVVQTMPEKDHAPTPLRVIDFRFRLWASPFKP